MVAAQIICCTDRWDKQQPKNLQFRYLFLSLFQLLNQAKGQNAKEKAKRMVMGLLAKTAEEGNAVRASSHDHDKTPSRC